MVTFLSLWCNLLRALFVFFLFFYHIFDCISLKVVTKKRALTLLNKKTLICNTCYDSETFLFQEDRKAPLGVFINSLLRDVDPSCFFLESDHKLSIYWPSVVTLLISKDKVCEITLAYEINKSGLILLLRMPSYPLPLFLLA